MAERTQVNQLVSGLRAHSGSMGLGLLGLVFFADLLRRLATGVVGADTVVTFLWNGVVFGMAIGLAGIGLAMTYSILQFANFAHGDMITAGAFAGWAITFVLVGFGDFALDVLVLVGEPVRISGDLGIAVTTAPLGIVVGFFFAVVFTAALAVGLDRSVFRPMRGHSGIALLIASVGVALALRHTINFLYQPTTPSIVHGPNVPSTAVPIGVGTVTVNAHQITLVVVSLVLMASVHMLLQYTKLGTAMRAMADNEDLAKITGISTERIVLYTWIIGGGLTGAAGYLLALEQGFLDLTMGWDILLVIFAGVILGGIGSIYGAIVGGLTIGVVSQLSIVWLPSELTHVAAFAIMIIVLLVRPSGIFGGVTSV